MAGPRDEDADIFQGTSKSAEGFGAHACFTVLKEAGMHVEVHWQDGDSSSKKNYCTVYPDRDKLEIMYCSGHVGRQHRKQLQKLSKQKKFTEQFV